jgi:type III secretion protein C
MKIGFGLSMGIMLSCGMAVMPPCRAAEPNWPKEPYQYTVVNQDLRSVLARFGENIGVRVVLSDSVKGTVQGTPPSSSPREFLDRLAKAYGLDWYYDGTVLAISSESEQQTQSLSLHGQKFADVQRKLTTDGILDHRYAFRPGQATSSAVVVGPPQYISSIAHELGDQITPEQNGQMVVHDGDHVTVYRGPLYLPQ